MRSAAVFLLSGAVAGCGLSRNAAYDYLADCTAAASVATLAAVKYNRASSEVAAQMTTSTLEFSKLQAYEGKKIGKSEVDVKADYQRLIQPYVTRFDDSATRSNAFQEVKSKLLACNAAR